MKRSRKSRIYRTYGLLFKGVMAGILIFAAATYLSFAIRSGFASIGPSGPPGSGTGAIGVNSSGNLSVGTPSPQADTKFLILASSTDSSGWAMRILQPDQSPLFIVRNDRRIGIGSAVTSTASYVVTLGGDTWITGNTVMSGSLTASTLTGAFTGTLSAGNISSGQFGQNTGGGNYTFPANVTVNGAGVLNFASSTVYNAITMNNNNVYNANQYQIGDPGPTEGIAFGGTNWLIDVTPLDRSNASGNLNLYSSSDNIALWRPTLFVNSATAYTTVTSQASGGINFTTTGAGHITFNQGGNVGVGTTTPAYPLTVNGVIHSASGGFRFPDGTTQATAAGASNYVSGMVGFFTGSCPPGWSEYTSAQGRFIVGNPSGGTLQGTVGVAMTNLQNVTHSHTGPSHTHTGPSHSHTAPAHSHYMNAHTHAGPSHTHSISVDGTHTHGNTSSVGDHSHLQQGGSVRGGGQHSWSFSCSWYDDDSTGGGGWESCGDGFTNQPGLGVEVAEDGWGTSNSGGHYHAVNDDDGGHSHGAATGAGGTGATGGPSVANTQADGNLATTADGTGATGAAGNAATTGDSTGLPYIQLRACQSP